jgi:thiamine-monophosphate kinase
MQHYFSAFGQWFLLANREVFATMSTSALNHSERIPPVSRSETVSLATIGEFGLISRLTSGLVTRDGVITGIGDDAAVTALSPGMQLLTSTDMLLEDVHFRRSWHDPYRLGRKSLAVSVSDIAAMGARPRWALLSLAIPAAMPLVDVDAFMAGFMALAAEYRVDLIGGDTCRSQGGLVVSVTIMGEQHPDFIVRRSGAQPDDDIWVTGTVGDAALGLKLVEQGQVADMNDGDAQLIGRLLDPTPRVAAGVALAEAGLATAMIDVSDGLLADFGHIAEQSAVGGMLHLNALPLSVPFRTRSAAFTASPDELALSGGEDYELCFTAAAADREKIQACMKKCGVAVTRVGIVSSSPEVLFRNPDGSFGRAAGEGFNHFN